MLKLPGVVDLFQSICLSVNRGRVFVTGDNGLHRLATAVLSGRYSNIRVMTSVDFLDRAA